jgi:hypothetical protein
MLIHAPNLADWRVYVNQCPRYHRIPVTQSDTRFVDFIGDIHGAMELRKQYGLPVPMA